jgi:hypothetical protein
MYLRREATAPHSLPRSSKKSNKNYQKRADCGAVTIDTLDSECFIKNGAVWVWPPFPKGVEDDLMKFRIAAAITGLALISAPANALTLGDGTVVTASAPGVLSVFGGGANFNSEISPTLYGNSGPPQGPFTEGGANFSGDGILMLNPPLGAGGSLGLYAEPFHDTTQYLTVQPFGATETVDFAGAFKTLGLYWGSMDTYNSIVFYDGINAIATVTGTNAAASVPALANGDQANDATNRYITISNLLGHNAIFTSIVLTSTQNSFELDNLAWSARISNDGRFPTPLPGALALFAGGLGMIGLVAGRKKRKTVGLASGIAAA